MSRTATSTPPAPYFPQRTSTPTLRHASAPNIHQGHSSFRTAHTHHPQPRRKVKPLSTTGGDFPSEEAAATSTGHFRPEQVLSAEAQSTAQAIPAIPVARQNETLEGDAVLSPASPSAVSPSKSWMPNFGRMAKAVVSSGISISISLSGNGKDRLVHTPTPQNNASSTRLDIAASPTQAATPPPPAAVFEPQSRYTRPPEEYLAPLSPEDRKRAEAEWTEAEYRRITECARLCSQWPQSGYHVSKFGPRGARVNYEPQSSANPEHVLAVMTRQAVLEEYMARNDLNFWPAAPSPRISTSTCSSAFDADSEATLTDSSLPSPASSIFLSADEALADATAAQLKEAMCSHLLGGQDSRMSSQVSLISQLSGKPLSGKSSLNDLNILASGMALSSTEPMEIDSESGSLLISADSNNVLDQRVIEQRLAPLLTRPARSQSCGAKRPLFSSSEQQTTEEDKRRKVDEEMVVEEAMQTGVIQPTTRPPQGMMAADRMSASAPDLSQVRLHSQTGQQPSVFGHVVKTSDTHPIIVSLFFPPELLPTLAENLVMPSAQRADQPAKPLLLSSNIDVPSLVLSHVSTQPQHLTQIDGMKVKESSFSAPTSAIGRSDGKAIGNLMLSSCPGKRLRMDGPVKGRGPVFRDVATDLRRIKNEGVGCLVCCLDDAELALLGVPWESYRDVASSLGLDIIRLPMSDGFTPVSIKHFDDQVSRIVEQYTLRGINVLVHCRGGVGRAGLTACAWAIKMGFVQPHPSFSVLESAADRHAQRMSAHTKASPSASSSDALIPALEHKIVMSIVERAIAIIRSRRGLKAIESFEQVQFLTCYVKWLRANARGGVTCS